MRKLKERSDYEDLRRARISENQARLASLGLKKTISEIRALTSSPKCDKSHVRKHRKAEHNATPLRRSARLTGKDAEISCYLESEDESGQRKKTGKRGFQSHEVSFEALARRCENKSRGSLYHPVYGTCCHFCRQKKLCGEEGCKRCGDLDMDHQCIGKTDCSNCHSSNGVLCPEPVSRSDMVKNWKK